MTRYRNPHLPKDAKVVIGIGDSFTEGVGSWSKHTYNMNGGFIDPLNIPETIYEEMYQNSWVSQLCANHLQDHIPINLGIMGKGNRAAVKELYLNPAIKFENISSGYLVMMLSGIERFDFIEKDFVDHHFYTMWPNPWDKNATNKALWECYAKDLWSEKFVLVEALLNIKEAEYFAYRHNLKFIVTSAFDQRMIKKTYIDELGPKHKDLIESIPWKNFLYPENCKSFIEYLLTLDGRPELANGGFYDYYSKLKEPTEYITNCMHPTQEGYRIIASKIYDFIKDTDNHG